MSQVYKRPKWAVRQLVRETGLLEDICKHGVGHPNKDWLKHRWKVAPDEKYWEVHGCDGCCLTVSDTA